MSHSALVRVQAVLARLLPPAHAEALLGDLLEERRLRLRVGSPASVACWYWRQLASSLPVLLWSSFRRRSWFLTLVVAIGGYIAAAAVTSVLRVALSPMTTSALEVGQPAPGFTMHSTVGEAVRLADYQGKKNVMLFFFVAAFTGA